ncbi:hypothetical protein Cgig2_001129 [Carnegiea gigantea]|uniref:Endonuclease/exonuclease/phosphatase domain-containing protein n=1 Tax=Carnegiea gigantea TaxID=171969 RepID=A0A9Q1JS18_9CARY|nr:hypothetical protein Cgig2_001129 [Carnegiea gigantea]
MGFDHFDYTLLQNHTGGSWVLWNNDNCHASVLAKENRAIHMLVHDSHKSNNILVSGVYAPTQTREKEQSIMVNGKSFTWKKRINGSWVFKKLDRGITRHDFAALYPNISVVHGPFTFSDHCPLIISTKLQHGRNITAPFCFQNFWTKYPHLDDLVTKSWKSPIKGTKMFQLS